MNTVLALGTNIELSESSIAVKFTVAALKAALIFQKEMKLMH